MSLINDMLLDLERRRSPDENHLEDLTFDGPGDASAIQGLRVADWDTERSMSVVRWCIGPVAFGFVVVTGLALSQSHMDPVDVVSGRIAEMIGPTITDPQGVPGGNNVNSDRERRGTESLAALVKSDAQLASLRIGALAGLDKPRQFNRHGLLLSSSLKSSSLNQLAEEKLANDVQEPQTVTGLPLAADLRAEVNRINARLVAEPPAASAPAGAYAAGMRKRSALAGESGLRPVTSRPPVSKTQYRGRNDQAAEPALRVLSDSDSDDAVRLGQRNLKTALGSPASQRAHARFEAAIRLIRDGQLAPAQTELEAALEDDPGHEHARESLVGVLINQGRRDAALASVQAGLAIAPASSKLLFVHVRLLVELNRHEEALALLRGMPSDVADNPSRFAYMGAVLLEMGQSRAAVDAYRQAIVLAPQESRWWLGLGVALEGSGASGQAAAAFERASLNKGLSADARRYAATRAAALRR